MWTTKVSLHEVNESIQKTLEPDNQQLIEIRVERLHDSYKAMLLEDDK